MYSVLYILHEVVSCTVYSTSCMRWYHVQCTLHLAWGGIMYSVLYILHEVVSCTVYSTSCMRWYHVQCTLHLA